eukprot:7387415-Prymnesium_polylepis.1
MVDLRILCSLCGRGGRRVLAPKTRFCDLLGECDALRTGWTGFPVRARDGGCAGRTGLVPIVGLGARRGGFGEGRDNRIQIWGTCPNLGADDFRRGSIFRVEIYRDRPRSTEIDRDRSSLPETGMLVPGKYQEISGRVAILELPKDS